jgi:benzoate/toluate 1,2-dioxygenase subunit beta
MASGLDWANLGRVGTSPVTRGEVEDLLFAEAELLDGRRFEEWLELFTDDAVYWVPARHDETDPARQVSLIYDDRIRMGERVWRLTHGPAHAQIPPSSTSRLVGNLRLVAAEADAFVARSNFAIVEERKDVQRTFAGAYEHRFRRHGLGWRIAQKKATLVNSDAAIFNLTFMI